MIRVTLELVSARGADRDRVLGVAYIANKGEVVIRGSAKTYHYYDIWLSKTIPGRTDDQWKEGRAAITDDDVTLLRGQPDGSTPPFDNVKRGAWDLIYLALRAVVGKRNP